MEAENKDFRLSATLIGHSGDIRGVCAAGEGQVVSCSRDLTAKLWSIANPAEPVCATTFTGHARYLMAVCFIPPSAEHPNGLVATGSLDHTVNIYDPAAESPIRQLTGHSNAVCCIALGPDGSLLTSSWDGSAKVWRNFECALTLSGHEKSVTCIAAHPSLPQAITGSADLTLKVWNDEGVCVNTLQGHTDVVRALATVSDATFLSAANDSTIRLWSFHDAAALQVFSGHSAYIYGLCVVPGAGLTFASCGEDSCVKVWDETGCQQTLHLPCQSVWAINSRPNGDLVVGADDSITRVFTRDPARLASAEALVAYDEQVSALQVAKQSSQLGDLDKSTLPSRAALEKPGTRNGDNLLVNHGGQVEAYGWSAAENKWEFQGVVTDAVDDNKPDFTCTVELDGRNLKLNHNFADNPYLSAQRFIDTHELSQHFLEEIAQFIIQNSNAPTLATGGLASNPDPFTGGGAYRPGSSSAATGTSSSSGGADPFTGGGAYRPGSSSAAAPAAGAVDPFTGGGAYVAGSAASRPAPAPTPTPATGAADPITASSAYTPPVAVAAPPAAAATGAAMTGVEQAMSATSISSKFFPNRTCVFFSATKAEGIMKKLKEFSAAAPEQHRLTSRETTLLHGCLTALAEKRALAGADVVPFLDALERVLGWDDAQVFPGLDAVRAALLDQTVAGAAFRATPRHIGQVLTRKRILAFLLHIGGLAGEPAAARANEMLALRCLANTLAIQGLVDSPLSTERGQVLEALAAADIGKMAKGSLLGVATTLLNMSVLFCHNNFESIYMAGELNCLRALYKIMETDTEDTETLFRTLVALGTLMSGDETLRAACLSFERLPARLTALQAHGVEKVRLCARDVGKLVGC